MRDLASALRSVRPLVSIRFFYYCYCYCLPDTPANTCRNRVIVSPTMPHSGLFLPSFSRRGHGQATSHTRCFPTTHRLELGDSAGNPSLLPVISRCPPLPSTLEACPRLLSQARMTKTSGGCRMGGLGGGGRGHNPGPRLEHPSRVWTPDRTGFIPGSSRPAAPVKGKIHTH